MEQGDWEWSANLEENLIQAHDLGLELVGSRSLRQWRDLHSCITERKRQLRKCTVEEISLEMRE